MSKHRPSTGTGVYHGFKWRRRNPIWELIGRYEAGLVREGTHSHSTIKWMSDAIEGFFADHPRVKDPRRILITDVEDWKAMRLERYAWNTVRKELCGIKAFFRWLMYQGLIADDPVVVPRPQLRQQVREAPAIVPAVEVYPVQHTSEFALESMRNKVGD